MAIQALPCRIYLTGFMGSGKSTLGKKLSSRLGYSFFDTDHLFERRFQRGIGDFINTRGESAFRKAEQEILRGTFSLQQAVISTGGGLPCYFDNMDQINRHGLSIYIYLPPSALYSRLSRSKYQRPLISGLTGEQLLTYITRELDSREAIYRLAHIRVSGISLNAKDLETLLKDYLRKQGMQTPPPRHND